MKLTDLSLRALPFGEGQRDYTDDAVKGLSVRVGRRTKTFLLMIRRADSRERVTLGQYDPPHFTLSMAREKARDLLAEARIKKDQPAAMTFQAAVEKFKSLHIPTMRPGSQKQAIRIFAKRFTALSHRRLTDLKTSELAATLDAVTAPAEKLNAFIYLRAFLNWCYQRGYLDQNPITRLKAPATSRTRERVLSDEELVKVWNASSSENDFGAFIRILILTAQRKGQWYAFRPEFIQGDTITWPSEFMKSARTHTIPLTPTIARTIGNHSFQGWSEGRHKRHLLKLSQTFGWTLHDLRRTTATRMAELGVAPHVIERLLAHSTPGVAARYNRASYLPEMRLALAQFETKLMELVRGRGNIRNVRSA
jgi:integrase